MVARNAPCPCGSRRKHKLCCGTTRAEEWELARRLERRGGVLVELMELPLHFPRLRPAGQVFSAWADGAAAGELRAPQIGEGVALIEPKERARIERAHGKEFPAVWRSICADLGGDEALARRTVVVGAVLAAVQERQPPEPEILELVEESAHLRTDPGELLAFVLEAGDLWSIRESTRVDEALAAIPDELDDDAYEGQWNRVVERMAKRLATRWHVQRLQLLVGRLRAQLPFTRFPATSAALERACAAFEGDKGLRRRVATLLLADSLSWTRVGLPLAA